LIYGTSATLGPDFVGIDRLPRHALGPFGRWSRRFSPGRDGDRRLGLLGSSKEALAFARYVAGPAAQAGLYAASGGQAGHRAAWTSTEVDQEAGGFYSGTLATLDGAWLRPRHDGYMNFQGPASDRIATALHDGNLRSAVEDLERLFAASFKD
jgi:hypothetical protein